MRKASGCCYSTLFALFIVLPKPILALGDTPQIRPPVAALRAQTPSQIPYASFQISERSTLSSFAHSSDSSSQYIDEYPAFDHDSFVSNPLYYIDMQKVGLGRAAVVDFTVRIEVPLGSRPRAHADCIELIASRIGAGDHSSALLCLVRSGEGGVLRVADAAVHICDGRLVQPEKLGRAAVDATPRAFALAITPLTPYLLAV